MRGNKFFKRGRAEGASMTPTTDLPPVKGKGLSWKQASALGVAGFAVAACTTAVAAIATQGQTPTATPEFTPSLPPIKTPESTPTPTPPPPVEGPITGLYFGLQEQDGKKTLVGGVDGDKIEADLQAKGLNGYKVPIVDGAHEARINTYYYKDTPSQVSAFSSDDEYLIKYFKATVGKDGSIKGQIPGGKVVEKIGNLWVTTTTDGSPLVFNPLVMSRAGQLFGAPVILEKGGKVFLALVDANTGGLVTNPQDAFQTPAAIAAANGFKGPQAVGSIELLPSGLMVVRGPNREFVAEINFSGRATTFEQWVQTSTPDAKLLKQAEDIYAKAMGIDVGKIETSIQINNGVNGPYAVVVDIKTSLPILISSSDLDKERKWEQISLLHSKIPVSLHIQSNRLSSQKDQLIRNAHVGYIGWDVQWKPSQPFKDEPSNFSAADQYIHLSEVLSLLDNNNMGYIANGAFWAAQYPQWLKDEGLNMTQSELKLIMQGRIDSLAKEFEGRKGGILIVSNEYAPPNFIASGAPPDVLLDKFGPEYVDMAFQMARKSFPSDTKLILNHPMNETQTALFFNTSFDLAQRLKSKGLIDGVGMQMHLDGSKPIDKKALISAMKAFGLPIYITELDINMKDVQGTQEQRMVRQAEMYDTVIQACLESGVCVHLGFFDVGDKDSWYEEPGAQYMASPLADSTLFDDNFNPKPAYYYILRTLLNSEALK